MRVRLDILEKEMRSRLSGKRMAHTLGCVETAGRLATRWGANTDDAVTAAMLHDMTKELSLDEQLKFCEKHGIIISDAQKAVPEILHGITGAVAAKLEFNVSDEISGAIRWHSTGKPGMSKLEKIIWLADMTEPGRKFDGVEDIRRECEISLERAMIMGIDRTIGYLIERSQIIDTVMLEARNWLLLSKGTED